MRFVMQGHFPRSLLMASLVAAFGVGCGGTGSDLSGTGGGPNGGSGGRVSTGIQLGAGTPSYGGSPSAGRGPGPELACTGQLEAKGAPVVLCQGLKVELERLSGDLYFLMDRSISQSRIVPGSTTLRRWDVLRNAIAEFAQQVGASGEDIRMGLGFFGRTGGAADELDCDTSYYATPKVPIGRIPDVAAAVVDAIQQQVTSGLTPTRPAMEGAHQYAATYAAAHPERAVSVVLMTDGYPTQCDGNTINISGIKAIAEKALLAKPRVRTFVIGLEGEGNLNSIARGGGTEKAYIVDLKNDTGDVTAKLVDVLKGITNSPPVCTFELPEGDPGQIIAEDKVQFLYTPHNKATENLFKLTGPDRCAQHGGWYFSGPRMISVCDCNCVKFGSGTVGVVDIRVGCDSHKLPE